MQKAHKLQNPISYGLSISPLLGPWAHFPINGSIEITRLILQKVQFLFFFFPFFFVTKLGYERRLSYLWLDYEKLNLVKKSIANEN